MPEKNRRSAFAMAAYQWACDLEIRALKPGNVGDHGAGHDMSAGQFRLSATVSAAPLTTIERPLGERIYDAVAATRTHVGCNTNLGILLLSAPLIEAFVRQGPAQPLDRTLESVLQQLDEQDARAVFRAIALARPGGLGEVATGDVNRPPDLPLIEAMRLAAHRDRVALQYVSGYENIFRIGIPLYDSRLSIGDSEEWATAAVFLGFLSRYEDSHIGRKFGWARAQQVTQDAAKAAQLFGPTSVKPELILRPLLDLDRMFKAQGLNPGTTADLTVATLLAAKLLQFDDCENRGRVASTVQEIQQTGECGCGGTGQCRF